MKNSPLFMNKQSQLSKIIENFSKNRNAGVNRHEAIIKFRKLNGKKWGRVKNSTESYIRVLLVEGYGKKISLLYHYYCLEAILSPSLSTLEKMMTHQF